MFESSPFKGEGTLMPKDWPGFLFAFSENMLTVLINFKSDVKAKSMIANLIAVFSYTIMYHMCTVHNELYTYVSYTVRQVYRMGFITKD